MGISVTGSAKFKVTFLKMFVDVSFASRFCYDFYARVQKLSSVVMCTVSLYVGYHIISKCSNFYHVCPTIFIY